jgi:hypothetical protein
VTAVLEGEGRSEPEPSPRTSVVFVVAQVQRPERGAELHDRDAGCFGEARHERDAHI